MKNIRVNLTYNKPSEEAMRNFAERVMVIYNESKNVTKGGTA